MHVNVEVFCVMTIPFLNTLHLFPNTPMLVVSRPNVVYCFQKPVPAKFSQHSGKISRDRATQASVDPGANFNPPTRCNAGLHPQALLVCPIFHPENPSQPIGVLQCFNKRSRVGSFTQLDEFTIRLLTRYVAAAAVNADRFNIEYRLDLYARRIFDLTENIANERELAELPGRIFSRAKELLFAHRARLYFVAPGDGPVEHRLVQSPFVVCIIGRVFLCAPG